MPVRCGEEPVKRRGRKALVLSHVWPSELGGQGHPRGGPGGAAWWGWSSQSVGRGARQRCAQRQPPQLLAGGP